MEEDERGIGLVLVSWSFNEDFWSFRIFMKSFIGLDLILGS